MEYDKLDHVNKQHTTPKCYLKNFSDDGTYIYRKFKKVDNGVERNKELGKGIPLKTATVEDNFYTVDRGNEPMVIETLIYSREIENHYPIIYKLLIDPNVEGLNMEERTRLLTFFLSLHCRTPKQFKIFSSIIPKNISHQKDKIMEDYKGAHLQNILPKFIEVHQFKTIEIFKITDTSEFITSDNPILIIGPGNILKNNIYREQFNIENMIIVPIDPKHCCILANAKDKNGVSLHGKLFYNRIRRTEIDGTFTQSVNSIMLESGDKCYFGSEQFMKAFFSLWRFV